MFPKISKSESNLKLKKKYSYGYRAHPLASYHLSGLKLRASIEELGPPRDSPPMTNSLSLCMVKAQEQWVVGEDLISVQVSDPKS